MDETPVKMHSLSLARALSAMVDGKEVCFISEKIDIYHSEKIDILFWQVRQYDCQKKTSNLHKKAPWAKYDAYWTLSHLKLFEELATLIFVKEVTFLPSL